MNQQQDLEYLKRIHCDGNSEAREELVKKYFPMVAHIIKKQQYPISWDDFEDYFQEGAIGILKAIDDYDPINYSVKFSTFVYICILRRICNTAKQYSRKKAPAVYPALSLNCLYNEEQSLSLLERIPDFNFEPYSRIEDELAGQRLEEILKAYLSPVEYRVTKLFLEGYSLADIQGALSLSQKVVDNARTRARLKLKRVVFRYGSLLNPQIPVKIRKRKDLPDRFQTDACGDKARGNQSVGRETHAAG
ncbi:MAG: sigma-70 family RNA polymerase sigma factor [Firmicutes bacterium]|nr:sigma-70 family RNA polymerase sigma factor [Bacillota bacterium]